MDYLHLLKNFWISKQVTELYALTTSKAKVARLPLFFMLFFTLLKTSSTGFNSGLYAGRKITKIPKCEQINHVINLLWIDALSTIKKSPDFKNPVKIQTQKKPYQINDRA